MRENENARCSLTIAFRCSVCAVNMRETVRLSFHSAAVFSLMVCLFVSLSRSVSVEHFSNATNTLKATVKERAREQKRIETADTFHARYCGHLE